MCLCACVCVCAISLLIASYDRRETERCHSNGCVFVCRCVLLFFIAALSWPELHTFMRSVAHRWEKRKWIKPPTGTLGAPRAVFAARRHAVRGLCGAPSRRRADSPCQGDAPLPGALIALASARRDGARLASRCARVRARQGAVGPESEFNRMGAWRVRLPRRAGDSSSSSPPTLSPPLSRQDKLLAESFEDRRFGDLHAVCVCVCVCVWCVRAFERRSPLPSQTNHRHTPRRRTSWIAARVPSVVCVCVCIHIELRFFVLDRGGGTRRSVDCGVSLLCALTRASSSCDASVDVAPFRVGGDRRRDHRRHRCVAERAGGGAGGG